MNFDARIALVALLVLPAGFIGSGCNGPAPSSARTSGSTTSGAAPSAPPASGAASSASSGPSAAGAVFDVHEWGLVDVQSSSAASLVAGPPSGRTNWNAPRRKPVLYFHLADGAGAVGATVTVTTPRLGFVEVFPKGELSGDSRTLTWRGLHVRKEGCHVVGAPRRDAPECRTTDGLCEAAELPIYETADASCIDIAGASFNHLFYRANGSPPELPFEVIAKGNQLSITHVRATDTVGPIFYVHNEGGSVAISTIATPPVGQSVLADPPRGTDVRSAQSALDAAMKQVGLTEAEAAAFNRAWSNDLFGTAGAREAPARRGAIAPSDDLLFVLPASLVSGASTVEITPAPRALHRFMLVRLRV